uniref:RNA-dependent RNA polymerase n=1 Tax=Caloscypha fulgens partitivirus 1 TaxID=2778759 RepID=A0A7L8Y8R6_9VIRU|nr:RNA-dependent RNA polymerase [Caloscypha fulgens partitivirus 1]
MLTISQIVTINILLRFQHRRRSGNIPKQVSHPIRNIYYEWMIRSQIPEDASLQQYNVDYSRTLLHYIDLNTNFKVSESIREIQDDFFERYTSLDEPFNLHTPHDILEIPENRIPSNGLKILPFRYHQISPGLISHHGKESLTYLDPFAPETPDSREPYSFNPEVDLTGSPPHPEIVQIIHDWFPMFEQHIQTYCRPPSYGPQAFQDFNRPTDPIPPPSPQRENDILTIIRNVFAISPYRPLHFVDALAANTPNITSASYHDKFDTKAKAYARYSSPALYANRPQSKGYHFNHMMNTFRLDAHKIKNAEITLPWKLQFFLDHPTQLFIRSQISLRDPSTPKKIRPVYSVDSRFLHLEKMLTTNLLAQMRNPQCCVLHGLETFRGAMSVIDKIAHSFTAYVSLDWSNFDQRAPQPAIKCYYTRFLPSLLIVSHGYFPSRGYENTQQPIDIFATKVFNILSFLYLWYRNMVFLSFDGYAYTRLNGGVPSGLLNTQSLDSFVNMYVLADCLLEFGFTIQETMEMIFFILGDDNIFFARMNFSRIADFMVFLEDYAKRRHGMVVSILKSVYSSLRTKISVLGYENTYGMPTRPLGKLIAQLCFPERPVPDDKSWMHAARALGLATAACGQDADFHMLCYMVYQKFKPTNKVTSAQFRKVLNYAVLESLDFKFTEYMLDVPEFPTLYEIRSKVSSYAGPFNEKDKWNRSLFKDVPPSDNLNDFVTLDTWLNTHPEHSFDSQNHMQGYDSPDFLSVDFSKLSI